MTVKICYLIKSCSYTRLLGYRFFLFKLLRKLKQMRKRQGAAGFELT